MKLSHPKICFICVVLTLSTGYFVLQNIHMPNYTNLFMRYIGKARVNFLNNTFCGRFVSDTWNETISDAKIMRRSRFLEDRNTQSNFHFQNFSCSQFIAKNGFYSKTITDLEYANPMAFTILAYKHFYQFQVLMRTLYVRSNVHCIHVDRNASTEFYTYALKLSECLENIHVIEARIDVSWGDMSILRAERLCQSRLLNQSLPWHYHMTVAATELPIQTNLNRLQILQLVPDKSLVDVASFPQPRNRQASKADPPPGNMTVYKGEFHGILTREFIEAVHQHPLALKFYEYLNGTEIPDEQYYPSLVRLSDLPAAKARVVPSYTYDKLLSHYKIWGNGGPNICQSNQFVGKVCQFNYKDLANMEKSGRLFANKFNEENDVVGIGCWEEWLQMKQSYHEDIDSGKYIDLYPFTQRTAHLHRNHSANIEVGTVTTGDGVTVKSA